MHRSGTSLVAELLHGAGAYAGEEESLLPANEWNERGYWEYLPLVRFNDDLLACVDSSWSVPPQRTDEYKLTEHALDTSSREAALRLIDSMGSGGRTWFWKDPRLALVLPFWQSLWNDPIYVICIRNPLEIAHSLQRRFHLPLSASLLLWQCYMTSILRHLRGRRQLLFIEYERLVQTPTEQCARLLSFLSKHGGPSPGGESGNMEDLASIVRRNLKHHESRDPFDLVEIVSSEQKKLYSFLRGLVENPAADFDDADFGIYPGYREYLQTLDLLRQWLGYWNRLQSSMPALEQLPCPASTARVLGL